MSSSTPIGPSAQIVGAWRQAREGFGQLASKALEDPVLFTSMVLRDERSGRPIDVAPMHEVWQDLITQHDRLVIWAHIEAGKSQQISIARVLYELARNQAIRIAVVSNTHTQAAKIVRTIAQYIERSDALHLIAPKLRPGAVWTGPAITVERGLGGKDPSVQACGIHGNILGSRVDLLILDDVLDYENCRTQSGREDLIAWYNASLTGRLTDQSKVVVVGTAFHPKDLLHHLASTPSFEAQRFPVVDDITGLPNWPEHWPLARIAKARVDMGLMEFARQMLCRPRDDTASRFKWEWIQRCLARGEGKSPAAAMAACPRGYRIVTGVDLAVSKAESADLTSLFTIIIHPDDTRELLSIDTGKWFGPEIIQQLQASYRRYRQERILIENNAAQDYVLQFAREASAIPVVPFTTGRQKAHPEFGVEGLAIEMANGKWIIPNHDGVCHPEIQAWISEMLYYDPKGHTGDRLMSAWFSVEAARQGEVVASAIRADLLSR